MRPGLRITCFAVFLLFCSNIFAQTFPIIGSVNLVDATSQNIAGRGTDFFFTAYVGDAADPFGFCYSGQICNGAALNGATTLVVFSNQPPVTSSFGCLGTVCAAKGPNHGMMGILNVTYQFSFLTPNNDQTIDLAVPVTITGSVSAIGSDFSTLWTVNISANGTAKLAGDLSGGLLRFGAVTFKYGGTGTVASVR